MPERSTPWICWRLNSVIAVVTLWILVYYNSGVTKFGTTDDIEVEHPATTYTTHGQLQLVSP